MDQLCYVKLKNTLKHLDLEKQLVDNIDKRIKNLPDYQKLRLNPELILLVCNLVENAVFDKKKKKKKIIKVDKKDLVIRVLNSIFDYAEPEKKIVDTQIEFFYTNDDIKKVSFLKKCLSLAFEWIKKKLL